MATLKNDVRLRGIAEAMVQTVLPLIMRAPSGFGNWLCAIDYYLSQPAEILLVGQSQEDVSDFLKTIKTHYCPNVVVAAKLADTDFPLNLAIFETETPHQSLPLALICRNFVCTAPATTPQELSRRLVEQLSLIHI